ncbi:hypothetical protein B0A80_09580 [Flavobacterium tructae]|nr:hypothetical protein B0A80_09580 [Flavobacterium tructae]
MKIEFYKDDLNCKSYKMNSLGIIVLTDRFVFRHEFTNYYKAIIREFVAEFFIHKSYVKDVSFIC